MTAQRVTLADVPLALLAGGLGTRVGSVSDGLPKALLDVSGRPFVAHQLELLRRKGVCRVVICTGHLGDRIEQYVGDGARFDLRVDYSREGDRLLGTGGAVKHAASLLGEVFWVMYGDTYLDVDFAAILAAFEAFGGVGLMTVFRNDNRWDRSNVIFRDNHLIVYDKRVVRPEMTHIDYGLALLRRPALLGIPAGQPFDLADLYRDLVERREMEGFEVHQRFYEIGSLHGLAETRAFFERRWDVRGA